MSAAVTSFLFVLFLLTLVYLLFLRRVRQGLRLLESQASGHAEEELPSLCIVVSARNEQTVIEACVRSLMAQEYPPDLLRIFIVDDFSTDETASLASAVCAEDPRCSVIVNPGPPGKKSAITAAVTASDATMILTTDADCKHPRGWARAMASSLRDGVDVVSGPVLFDDRSTFFARMQALEFLGLVGVGAGLIGVGYPRLCNGANLGYRRACFLHVGGYAGNLELPSGDDEFLMQRIVYHLGGRAVFVTDPEGIVTTPPAPDLPSFLRQRMRWASKGARYESGSFVAFLGILFAYFVQLLILPLVLTSGSVSVLAAVVLVLGKWMMDMSILTNTARLLHAPIRIGDFLLAELFHAPYIVLSALLGSLARVAWKESKP